MTTIKRSAILLEKASGTYSCPHFVAPAIADEIAASCQKRLGLEASKAIAEIAENFAMEVLKACSSEQPSCSDIRSIVAQLELQ